LRDDHTHHYAFDLYDVFDHSLATTTAMITRTVMHLNRGGLVVAPKVQVVAKQWSNVCSELYDLPFALLLIKISSNELK